MTAFTAFFLKYILLPLMVVIFALVTSVISKGKSVLKKKRLIIFVLLTSLLIAVPVAFLGLFGINFYPFGLLGTYAYFFLFGFLLVRFTYTNLFDSIGFGENLVPFMVSVIVCMIIGGWLHYIIFDWINDLDYIPYISLGVIWILTPIFVKWAEDFFIDIPPKIYKLWYPEKNMDYAYWETIDLRRLKETTVRIRKDPNDEGYANIDAKIPSGVSIGHWFNRFIEDHDIKFPGTPMVMSNEDEGELYGWVFYKKRFIPLFDKPIDFEKTTDVLKIKDKTTIIAKRVVESDRYDY